MPSKDNISEQKLITRVRKGDAKAFESLYYSYCNRLSAFLSSLHLDQYSDDVIQETFITIWKKRRELDPKKSFTSYLFTIAKNYALKALKKQLNSTSDILKVEMGDNCATEQTIRAHELECILQRFLKTLPERPGTVFRMRRLEGLTINQIAKKLNISPKTVENHMNTALSALRKNADYFL